MSIKESGIRDAPDRQFLELRQVNRQVVRHLGCAGKSIPLNDEVLRKTCGGLCPIIARFNVKQTVSARSPAPAARFYRQTGFSRGIQQRCSGRDLDHCIKREESNLEPGIRSHRFTFHFYEFIPIIVFTLAKELTGKWFYRFPFPVQVFNGERETKNPQFLTNIPGKICLLNLINNACIQKRL